MQANATKMTIRIPRTMQSCSMKLNYLHDKLLGDKKEWINKFLKKLNK